MYKKITIITATALTLIISGCCCGKSECGSSTKCGIACSTCTTVTDSEIKHLNIEEVDKIVTTKSATVLDARSGKWDTGERIPGAKSLSSKSSEAEITKMLPDKNAAILTYCSNTKCPASKMLATKLQSMGYTNISEYAEGIKGWKEAGKPIEKVK